MKTILSGTFFMLFTLLNPLYSQVCDGIEISSTVRKTIPDCNRSDGEIVFGIPKGGTAPYTFTLDTNSTETGAFFDLIPGLYTVRITDSRGCFADIQVDLSYRELKDIIRPYNTFTPNGDDINDTWIIPGIESFQSSIVNIYNKWGQQVHLNSPYSNEQGWDGRQFGSELPVGTYYYVISVFNNCKEEFLAGTVNIIR